MDPIPAWLQRIWDAWDIRVMVLVSLTIQIILIILGSRRKYYKGIWIEGIVWSAYLMADSVVLFALGKLSDVSGSGNSNAENALWALWAPMLLLHLGGPDTITAYSIEDTQLWLRQLLGLVSHVVIAVYIFLRCWTGTWITYFTFPVFVAGTIKYAERTWVLWFANNENQRASDSIEAHAIALDLIRDVPGVKMIVVSYFWLQALTPYLANYGGDFKESERVAHMSAEFDSKDIFKLIEFVLEFMYDVLYTKAPLIYRRAGAILRAISLVCMVSMLLSFSVFNKHGYVPVDVIITYILLGGAVAIEIYAVVIAIFSNWGILQMIRYCRIPLVAQLVQIFAPWALYSWKRWSNNISQINLINFVLYKERSKMYALLTNILKLVGLDERFKKYRCRSYVDEFGDTKQLIFEGVEVINEKLWEFDNFTFRGELALERNQCLETFKWCIEKDFDQSIIAWHLATDMCYHLDKSVSTDGKMYKRKEISKHLSEYMMYLLTNHPYMLRIKGNNEMLERTSSHLKELLGKGGTFEGEKKPFIKDKMESWKKLLEKEVDDDESSAMQRWPPPRSALVLARILARTLVEEHPNNQWDILSGVWVEMLCHGASQCQVNYHAKRLTRGGELLTHVWLLLTIYGLTEKAGLVGSTLRKIFIGKSTKATQMVDWAEYCSSIA